MKRVIYFAGVFLVLLLGYFLLRPGRPNMCDLVIKGPIFDTIKYESFADYCPQNGTLERDTVSNKHTVHVPLDKLYFDRMSVGTKATTIVGGRVYSLTITQLHPTVANGRFNVDMQFDGEITTDTLLERNIRLRVKLGETSTGLFLHHGHFYFDTGGKWIFVVEGNQVVRRTIKLGPKMIDGFEVLAGLNLGDRVLTSSYEKFMGETSIDLDDLEEMY